MNERLKELEKQSVFYNDDDDNFYFDREVFAELIIQECVFAVENHGGMCGVTSSKKIKEHFFGVEE